MKLIVLCQHCHKPLEIEEEWLGMETSCPICGKNTKLLAAPQLRIPTPREKVSKKISKTVISGGIALAVAVIVIAVSFCFKTEKAPEKKIAQKIQTQEKRAEVSPRRIVQKKTAEPVLTIPQIDPFDISDMFSGVPAVKPSDKIFKIEDHFHKLNTSPKDAGKRRRNIRSISLDSYKLIADQEIVFAVQHGFIHSLRFLLGSGYDINGRYRSWEYEYRHGKRTDSLLEHLLKRSLSYRGMGTDKFVKTYIFLVENGADVNAPFSDGTSLMSNLLEKCNHSPRKILWKLVPFTLAYGGKLDIFLIEDAKLKNAEFKKFVLEVSKRNFARPERVVENRRGKYWTDAAKYKFDSPAVAGLTVINRDIPNDLIVCDHGMRPLTMTKLKAYMSKGGDINCLQFCTWGGHGGGEGTRKAHYLFEYLPDLPMLQFLLVNGWRYGIDAAVGRFRNYNECSELLWEFGVDVTAMHLNSITEREVWQKFFERYKRQRCQFGWEEIEIRSKDYWDYHAAREAVRKRKLDALKQIVEGGWDVNNRPNGDEPLLFYALNCSASLETIKYLLDKKANVRNKGYHCGSLVLKRYNMELIKFFNERALLDLNETEVLDTIKKLLEDAYSYERDNYVAVFEWIMNKWKLSPEKINSYCIKKTKYSAYGLLLKKVSRSPFNYYETSRKVVQMLEKHGFVPRASELAAIKISSYAKKTYPKYCDWVEKLKRENP